MLGACMSILREPRWLGTLPVHGSCTARGTLDPCTGADARRAAPAVVGSTDKPRNTADAPSHRSDGPPGPDGCARAKCPANPKGPGRFPLTRRCRLLIGS